MKKVLLTASLLVLIISEVFSQKSFMTYYEMRDFLYTPPSAFRFGLLGYNNPSLLSTMEQSEIQFTFTNENYINRQPKTGLFYGGPGTGIGFIRNTDGTGTIYDYRFAMGFGSAKFGLGAGYGFTGGDKSYFRRSNIFYFGGFFRPLPYFSIGAQFTQAIDNHDQEFVGEIGIRPIKYYPLTLFADASMFENQSPEKASWSGGIAYEFLDGVRVSGRYFNNKSFNIGIDISFGNYGIGTQANFNNDKKYGYSAFTARLGAFDRTIFNLMEMSKKFLKLDLKGPIKYQKAQFFDEGNNLRSVLGLIEEAKKRDEISGIIINITGMKANHEMLWEIRESLKNFRKSGKLVYIFTDIMDMPVYHFASVADKIIMDTQGGISLEGFMLSGSYYKGLFEKAGLGFEELRYFKYKSAFESLSRDKMSDADREQRQKIVDDWFSIARDEIMISRGFSKEKFDSLVNGNLLYSAKEAIENKLVDETGRWVDCDEVIKKIRGKDSKLEYVTSLEPQIKPLDDKWGYDRKYVAIIYALGVCAMDEGIKARSLIKDLKAAYSNSNIAAIVLRVDSPGGEAMASDYIADFIKNSKIKKPVIVSQGRVAGSGGYWLSMYGDKIVASPMTITGSVGVIGGRIYNKSMKEYLGISVDAVKAGKYADLKQNFDIPLINASLPVRNFNDDEKKQLEKHIRAAYTEFVGKVAEGRKTSADSIEMIAQGRVWSGLDGKKNGLIDEIGGLETAVEIALKAAGITEDEQVFVVEYPAPELLPFLSMLSSAGIDLYSLLGIKNKSFVNFDFLDYVRFRAEHNDKPMVIMPLEYQELVPVE